MQRVSGPQPADAERTVPAPPVFLVGPARSGTSLLYKVLCLHPEAAYISNWVARFPRVTRLAALNRWARRRSGKRMRVWFGDDSNAYVYGKGRRRKHRGFPMPVEGEPVFSRCGIPQDRLLAPDGLWREGQALRRELEAIRVASGGSVFINKRIANNLRIAFLAAAFPDARFVSIVRDGRAVALSLSRVDWWPDSYVWWAGTSPRQWASAGKDPWAMCARNWVEELDAIGQGLTLVPEEQVLRLTYESFVDDPVATVGRVASFAGLPDDDGWRRTVSGLSFPDRNEAWRSQLDADAARIVRTIQFEKLRDNGYVL